MVGWDAGDKKRGRLISPSGLDRNHSPSKCVAIGLVRL
jgi:hypothetical protein